MSRKTSSSAPCRSYALGHLHRVAGVAQVDEADALDHPAAVDVQAGDDPLGQHQAHPIRPAHGLGQVDRAGVECPADDHPGDPRRPQAAASAGCRPGDDTPPEAITGRSVPCGEGRQAARLGPSSVPSREMSV